MIDCPPTLGVLTTNTLVAAQVVIVPLQCEYLALRALKQLEKIIATVRKGEVCCWGMCNLLLLC
jgi:chromosome partitioning protein